MKISVYHQYGNADFQYMDNWHMQNFTHQLHLHCFFIIWFVVWNWLILSSVGSPTIGDEAGSSWLLQEILLSLVSKCCGFTYANTFTILGLGWALLNNLHYYVYVSKREYRLWCSVISICDFYILGSSICLAFIPIFIISRKARNRYSPLRH